MARRSTRRSKTRTHALTLATYTAADFSERTAAVRRAADVHAHGAAALGRLAIGVVGGDGLFPINASRRLCLRPRADNLPAALCAGRNSSCASDRGRARAPAGDCRGLGHATGDRYCRTLASRSLCSLDRPAVPRVVRQQSAVAGLVRAYRPPDAHDPYFLYAASNVGSFLALLAYPALFEPVFTLQMQNRMWSFGFVLLILLVAGCAVLMLRDPRRRTAEPRRSKAAPKPTWPAIGRWVFISAVPSGLLIAVTAYVSTDVAAAPLLWVIPLSLYLLTWVLVFQRRPLIPHRIALLLQPFAVATIVVLLFYTTWIPIFFNLGGHLLAFFVIALACHGELARTRPPPRDLTTFYVSLSFGGMVGGLFAGLVAPYAFSWVAEYPILAVLAVLCRPLSQDIWKPFNRWLWPLSPSHWPQFDSWFWPATTVIAIFLLAPGFGGAALDDDNTLLTTAVLALAGISIVLFRDPAQVRPYCRNRAHRDPDLSNRRISHRDPAQLFRSAQDLRH